MTSSLNSIGMVPLILLDESSSWFSLRDFGPPRQQTIDTLHKTLDRSRYRPHQGQRERNRRMKKKTNS